MGQGNLWCRSRTGLVHRTRMPDELKWIQNLHKRNPHISICEMYGKLLERGYTRHIGSLYRVFVRLGYREKVESTKKESQHLGHYDTPTELGRKWQLDVKYVPKICYVGEYEDTFYQEAICQGQFNQTCHFMKSLHNIGK